MPTDRCDEFFAAVEKVSVVSITSRSQNGLVNERRQSTGYCTISLTRFIMKSTANFIKV
jgi:hypothetical protein